MAPTQAAEFADPTHRVESAETSATAKSAERPPSPSQTPRDSAGNDRPIIP